METKTDRQTEGDRRELSYALTKPTSSSLPWIASSVGSFRHENPIRK